MTAMSTKEQWQLSQRLYPLTWRVLANGHLPEHEVNRTISLMLDATDTLIDLIDNSAPKT